MAMTAKAQNKKRVKRIDGVQDHRGKRKLGNNREQKSERNTRKEAQK
jgi:hypothetical protein